MYMTVDSLLIIVLISLKLDTYVYNAIKNQNWYLSTVEYLFIRLFLHIQIIKNAHLCFKRKVMLLFIFIMFGILPNKKKIFKDMN